MNQFDFPEIKRVLTLAYMLSFVIGVFKSEALKRSNQAEAKGKIS
jgi:hypothetical protein